MTQKLNQEALALLFHEARTHSTWLDHPVTDETLRDLYNAMKFGPTSMNCTPARFLFLRSREAKERLRPFLMQANVDKTMAAPVTTIVAYDLKFYERLPQLFPHYPGAREIFANNADLAQITATRNGTLQGGYFIMAARALGLDCGPMSGFDNAKVDAEFFAGEPVKSNFLCNLGYGDASKLPPRNPRLEFEEACRVL
jgi:3-hydroxypropanoate dehydrogenase